MNLADRTGDRLWSWTMSGHCAWATDGFPRHRVAYCKCSLLHAGHVVPELNPIDGTGRAKRPEVRVLLRVTLRVGRRVHSSSAIDDSADRCSPRCPTALPGDQILCEAANVDPAPARTMPAAELPSAVIEVVTVDVHANVHGVEPRVANRRTTLPAASHATVFQMAAADSFRAPARASLPHETLIPPKSGDPLWQMRSRSWMAKCGSSSGVAASIRWLSPVS